MFSLDDPGRAERLYVAIRERAPQVATSISIDEETGLPLVRVTFRNAGPWTAGWDGESYRLRMLESDPWTALPADAEEAVDAITETLRSVDARPGPAPPTDETGHL